MPQVILLTSLQFCTSQSESDKVYFSNLAHLFSIVLSFPVLQLLASLVRGDDQLNIYSTVTHNHFPDSSFLLQVLVLFKVACLFVHIYPSNNEFDTPPLTLKAILKTLYHRMKTDIDSNSTTDVSDLSTMYTHTLNNQTQKFNHKGNSQSLKI